MHLPEQEPDSPVERNRHGAQPRAQNGANKTAVDFVDGQQQRSRLSPCLAFDSVDVDQREVAEQRNVGSGQEGLHVVRRDRGAEQDEDGREEGRRSERRQEKGEERGLQRVSSCCCQDMRLNLPQWCR
jgi:hypothetical protein